MHRQAPIAFGVLASCAVIASGSILLREQILSFSSWPEAGGGGNAPEIAIPNVRPLVVRNAGAGMSGETTPRVRTSAARAGLLGLGVGGGTFALLPSRPVNVDGGAAAGGGTTGAPSGPQLTTTGRTGSGHPDAGPAGDPPLSAYGEGIPVAGDAGADGSGVSPLASGSVPLEPTAAIRVAAPQVADVAPEADPAPVISSADNAPPPTDPAGTPVLVPEPPPIPDPTPDPAPAPDPTPAPAEPAPPADPAPPVETPAPPVEDAPAPPVEAPALDPAPEVPPAPADPAPPADDPGIAPAPSADPTASVATDPAPAPAE
jgi:hypothetical protein